MTITAIIPVKAKSSRFPGKNTMPFAGSNLLINKIRQIKRSGVADEIIVSSDSPEMVETAVSEGVRGIDRPLDLADESRPFGDFLVHISDFAGCEHIMWSPVTSPMLDELFYKSVVLRYSDALSDGYDSLTTVEDFKHFLMGKDGKPYNFDPSAAITNSQQLPEMYKWTCGCSIISIERLRKHRFIFGNNPYCYELTQYQAVDIDTKFDYEFAKVIYEITKR